MSFSVRIAGTEVYGTRIQRRTLTIEERVNNRNILSAAVLDRDDVPVYRPAALSTVIATDDEETGTGAITASGTVLTLTAGSFSIDDEGKTIEIFGADTGSQPLWAEIGAYIDPTHVGISRAAVLTVSGVTVRWGVRRFGGSISSLSEAAIGGNIGIRSTIKAVDFNELADRRQITKKTYAAGQTLKQVFTDLVTVYLAVFGVFVDPAMANGPTLEEQVFDAVSVSDAFRHLSEVTGWIAEIDYIRQAVMRAPVPSSTPAELTTGVNCNVLDGSVWTQDTKNYRNVQIVRIGSGTQDKVTNFVGNGTTRVFPLDYTPVTRPSQIEIPTGSANYANVGVHGVDTLFPWTYRSSDNAIVQLADAPPGTPNAPVAGGVQFRTVPYAAAFPMAVSYTNGLEFALRGPYEKSIDAPEIFDRAAGIELATGLVRRYSVWPVPKHSSVTTLTEGFHAGQQGPVTIAERAISGQHLIEAVRAKDIGADDDTGDIAWYYEIDAIEGSEYQGSWVEWFQQLGGGSSSGSAVGGLLAGSGSGGTVGPGQFRVLLGLNNEDDYFKAPAANTWFDAPGHVDWVLLGSQIPGLVRMRVHLRSTDTNAVIEARYFDTSASAPVSDATTGVNVNTPTHREVFVTLDQNLAHVYRLQLRVTGTAALTARFNYWKPTLENG